MRQHYATVVHPQPTAADYIALVEPALEFIAMASVVVMCFWFFRKRR